MSKEEIIKLLEENDFKVFAFEQDGEECVEIECWTNGGINMIAVLQPVSVESFEACVMSIDIDEEIDLHRQDPLFRQVFTIQEALVEFNEHYDKMHGMLKILQSS